MHADRALNQDTWVFSERKNEAQRTIGTGTGFSQVRLRWFGIITRTDDTDEITC